MAGRVDVGAAGLEIDPDDRQERQHRAKQGVEEEFEGGIDAPRPAPDADDQEHRHQHALEEHIEQDEVEGAENADHHRLEDEKGDHVLAHLGVHVGPAGGDAEHGQEGRQQHEEQRDAVDPHVVVDRKAADLDPARVLDELEGGGRGSNSTHRAIDNRNTITEVDSATLRALRATISSSPRASMMNSAPRSGRNVTSDSSGQWVTPPLPQFRTGDRASFETAASRPPQEEDRFDMPRTISPHPEERPRGARLEGRTAFLQSASSREEVPGDEGDDADQHREGVVVDIAGLQAAGFARRSSVAAARPSARAVDVAPSPFFHSPLPSVKAVWTNRRSYSSSKYHLL